MLTEKFEDKTIINLYLESGDIITIYFDDLTKSSYSEGIGKLSPSMIKGRIHSRFEKSLKYRGSFCPSEVANWYKITDRIVMPKNNWVRENKHKIVIPLDKVVGYSFDNVIFDKLPVP